MIGKSHWISLIACLVYTGSLAQTALKAATGLDPAVPSTQASQAAYIKAKSSYQAGQYKEAQERLSRLVKQNGKSAIGEEALILLTDVELRLNHPDLAASAINRFKRNFENSAQMPRMTYFQGQIFLRQGKNGEAIKAFATAAVSAGNTSLYGLSTKALWHIIDNGGLLTEDMVASIELLERDADLKAQMMERIGDQYIREGRFQAARNIFEDWLEKFGKAEGASRIKVKLKQATEAPQQNRTVLLMAPMTGEYQEIGRSLKEGALLAFEENNARGMGNRIETRLLDDQGNLIVGIHRLRKTMREEKIDAVVGPAMSDISAAAAIDFSARKSKVPLVTPTATTHGIAALGDGIFQLNVTTATLGQRVASHAVSCLKLKDFAIIAPNSEYGYQLAEAFQKTVEKKGGTILTTQYYEPETNDLGPQYQEIRKQAIKVYFEKLKMETGAPDPDGKTYAKTLSDSTLMLDGIFMPATNGEETYKVASQASFNKLRAQFLGSSGWNDKTILHRSGANALVGAIFSVDFQENPKTEAWSLFQRGFTSRWKHAPDKVAALSYDAAKFIIQGMASAPKEEQLIPSLKAIHSFNGVLGKIGFDEKNGSNTNAALYQIEKKGFKEIESCPEAD